MSNGTALRQYSQAFDSSVDRMPFTIAVVVSRPTSRVVCILSTPRQAPYSAACGTPHPLQGYSLQLSLSLVCPVEAKAYRMAGLNRRAPACEAGGRDTR